MMIPEAALETDATSSRKCSRCTSIKQACDGSMPCGRCMRLSLPCQQSSDSMVQPKAKITRVHTGCGPCKRKKRKCDEQKPRCSSCVKFCLDCYWPEGWRRRQAGAVDSNSSPSLATSLSAIAARSPTVSQFNEFFSDSPIGSPVECPSRAPHDQDTYALEAPLVRAPSLAPQLESDQERYLLGHFISKTAVSLTRVDSTATNIYLRYLIPLAFSDQSVMSAILGLSASQQQRGSAFSHTALYYQSKASRQLHKLLSSLQSTSSTSCLMALATSLILCMTELYGGSTDAWKQHLRGAKQLLDIAKDTTGFADDEMIFLEDLCHFLDTASTISTCRPPLRPIIDPGPYPQDSSLPIYGIPRLLFHLLDRVNSLAYQRRTRIDEESEQAFRQMAQSVSETIDFHINACELQDRDDRTDVTHASSAFKWAMRLRLHQIIDGYDAANPEIIHAVQKILNDIRKVPLSSPSEATLVFPLIMAAGACTQNPDRDFIRARLVGMKERSGFGHVYAAHELAERVWTYRDLDNSSSCSEPVNWAKIRHQEMHGLVIF